MRRTKHTWTAAILIYSLLLIVPPSTLAVDNGVLPFSFSTGTPAKASEVNQNFQYVNYSNLVLIDGTGAELGAYISSRGEYTMYMNNNGYIIWLRFFDIAVVQLYFSSSNCTGNIYMLMPTDIGQNGIYSVFPGSVWVNDGNLYYIPKNATFPGIGNNIQTSSFRDTSGACTNLNMSTDFIYQLFPNDPSVTGESSRIKTPTLRVIRRIQ